MAESNVGGAGGGVNGLFQGKQFWLSQNIPQRSRFKDLIQQHGGVIRLQERDAEIKLVDHARRNLPPDAYSYQFVEQSIRKGRLENLEDHRAGPSAQRPAGATNISSSGTRMVYTLDDDQILWDWMQKYEKQDGAGVGGNKAYMELAEQYPRHTWQSYRERYRRKLRGQRRPGGMPQSTNQTATTTSQTITVNPPTRPSPASGMSTTAPRSASMASERPEERKRKRSHDNDRSEDTSNKRKPTETKIEVAVPIARRPPSKESETTAHSPTPSGQITQELETSHTEEAEPPQRSKPSPMQEPENMIDSIFLELPFFPLESEQDEEEGSEQDIDAWIDDRLGTGKAQNETQIIEALRCASMDPDLADKVLGHLTAGKGIPDDIPGVWTSEDDKCIEGSDARDVERVLKKHGSEYFNARWEYLSMARDAGF